MAINVIEERGTIRSIAWQQVFPSLRLLTAIRMALELQVAAAGGDRLGGHGGRLAHLGPVVCRTRTTRQFADGDLATTCSGPGSVRCVSRRSTPDVARHLVRSQSSRGGLERAERAFSADVQHVRATHASRGFMYLLCCALWSLLVWSFFGGAISRQAAVAFARQENVSLGGLGAIRSRPLELRTFVAPLFPMLGAGLVAAAIGPGRPAAAGATSAWPSRGVLWPLVLFGGFVMAFLLLGLFFGFPLMWSAISAEGTDSFGALSHAYSYVYQRPLRYLGYAFVAGTGGRAGMVSGHALRLLDLESERLGRELGKRRRPVAPHPGPREPGAIGDTGRPVHEFWTNCLLTLALALSSATSGRPPR